MSCTRFWNVSFLTEILISWYIFFVLYSTHHGTEKKVGNTTLYLIFPKYGSKILLFEGLGVILTFFEMTLEFDRSVLEKLHEASYVVCTLTLRLRYVFHSVKINDLHAPFKTRNHLGFFLHTCIHHSIFIRTVSSKLLFYSLVVH